MDINRAFDALKEIEDLLYAGACWDSFWTHVLHEIWADDVDNRFLEAFAKLNALCLLDNELSQFINSVIKGQARSCYNKLFKTRRSNMLNSRVYAYLDVLCFIKQSQSLTQLLYQKIEQIHEQADSAPSKVAQVAIAP
jgi:vacuolar-type H+-ATPase catalytic subunit A/Vma1